MLICTPAAFCSLQNVRAHFAIRRFLLWVRVTPYERGARVLPAARRMFTRCWFGNNKHMVK